MDETAIEPHRLQVRDFRSPLLLVDLQLPEPALQTRLLARPVVTPRPSDLEPDELGARAVALVAVFVEPVSEHEARGVLVRVLANCPHQRVALVHGGSRYPGTRRRRSPNSGRSTCSARRRWYGEP